MNTPKKVKNGTPTGGDSDRRHLTSETFTVTNEAGVSREVTFTGRCVRLRPCQWGFEQLHTGQFRPQIRLLSKNEEREMTGGARTVLRQFLHLLPSLNITTHLAK